jgi:hypothetical protein
MRTLGYMVVVLALTAVAADAAIFTDPNDGAQALKLKVLADGTATITNVTAANVLIDAYEIWSSTNKLDTSGWMSIEDYYNEDDPNYDDNYAYVKGKLGTGSSYFTEVPTVSSSLLAELNSGTNKAGTFKVNDPFNIGKAFTTPVIPQLTPPGSGDITFYYTLLGNVGNKFVGLVEIIPEPATLLLVAGGTSVFILKRRRRT